MVKRDRIFIFVTAAVLGNLVYCLSRIINQISLNYSNLGYWALLIADALAIVGIFYFMRTYLKGRKIAKLKESKEREKRKEKVR
jgi:hypothetical protein